MATEQNTNFLTSWELVEGNETDKSVPPAVSNPEEHAVTSPKKAKKPSSPPSSKSLCGYLSKQGGRGIIKPWRTRWFVFDDSRCMLFYYRSPQDFVPLGHIDISIASLSFDLENVDKGQFEIKVEDRVFYLQADSKQAMMFWLNQLQAKRKASSRLRRLLDSGTTKDEQYSGLAQVPNSHVQETLEERLAQRPPEANSAPGAPPPPSKTVDWSLTSLKQEFRTAGKRLGNTAPARPAALPSRKASYKKGLEDSDESVAFSGTDKITEVPTADRVMATPATPLTTPGESATRQHVAVAAARRGSQAGSPVPTTGASNAAAPPDSSSSSSTQPRRATSKSRLGSLFNTNRRTKDTKQSDGDSERQQQQEQQPPQQSQSAGEGLRCHRCASYEQRLSTLTEEVEILETEVGARQRLIQDFHQQLTATKAMLRSSEQFVASPNDNARIKLLCTKDEEIAKLQGDLVQKKDEIDRTDVLLEKLRREIVNLTDQCTLYQETLAAKDEVVVAMSNELFQLKKQDRPRAAGGPVPSSCPAAAQDLFSEDAGSPMAARGVAMSTTIGELKGAVEQLKDTVGAYQLQNDFLNTEIVELDHLRQEDKKLISSQSSKMVEMEATYLKLHSNHLIILQEMQKPQLGGMQQDPEARNTQEMVSRLLEDAMETDVSTGMEINPIKPVVDDKYDRYGFERAEELSIAAKATTLARRGNELEMLEGGHRARWEAYVRTRASTRRFEFTNEVKNLTRQGIPAEFRTEVWRDLIYARVESMMQSKGPGYYQSLHQMSDSKGSLVYKQIELDLLRTLPGNKYYNKPDAAGVLRLRRLLRAFAWHNPVVGYCQGLNRLAAIALLVLNEEDAFWCLVLIVDFLMPKTYYSTTLMASQVDQRVLKDLMAMKLPRLASHLDNHSIDIGLITFNWFLTVFVDNVPFETVLLVWDSFLYEGCKVLFRFALGVFKLNEDRLMQLEDTSQIFQQMREMASGITDNRALSQAAFPGLNPFPMRVINKQRAIHTAVVKEELAEMESLRNTHQESTFESQRNDPAMIVFSDDDDN